MSLDEWFEEHLEESGMSPDEAARVISDVVESASQEDALELIRDRYTLTRDPGRRSTEYCLFCNPHLNGKHGQDGTEAIAVYRVEDIPDKDQGLTGRHGVCERCLQNDQIRRGATPLPGYEDHEVFLEDNLIEHKCENPSWTKTSLVTENEGFDWVECDECGQRAKRWGMGEEFELVE